jgi:hypothetical protein
MITTKLLAIKFMKMFQTKLTALECRKIVHSEYCAPNPCASAYLKLSVGEPVVWRAGIHYTLLLTNSRCDSLKLK